MLVGVEVREHQGASGVGDGPHFDQFDPPLATDGACRRSFFAEYELTPTTAADGTSISGSWRDRFAEVGGSLRELTREACWTFALFYYQ
jgi:hypothetical protein